MTGDTDIDRDTAQLALFEASRPRLFSLAYRILGVRADAEDVVQDTFVKWHLHQRVAGGSVAGGNALDTPAAWLATVAKRSAIDRLRRLKHETPLPEGFDGSEGLDFINHAPSAQTLAEQTSDLLYGMRRVLDRLSAEERVAFLLREAFEADYASIAKILNRSAAHCRQMVHRAKDRVRDDRKNNDSTHTAQAEDAIEPLLDAIARQDVSALVALTLATTAAPAPMFAPVAAAASATATSAALTEQQAAVLTRALIARLRLGRIDLPASIADERVSALVAA
jgi:RNA polymerase sigma factor (sigma-70 family)